VKNRKHFWAVLIALMLLLSIFSACSAAGATDATGYSPTQAEEQLVVSPDTIGFEEVASYGDVEVTYIYYRCRTTNAMYVWRQCDEYNLTKLHTYSGFTAMLDPETGGPLTYERWLAYLEAKTGGAGE